MTYQEFVNAYFGWEIDVNELSAEDDDMLSVEYQRDLAQKNAEEE